MAEKDRQESLYKTGPFDCENRDSTHAHNTDKLDDNEAVCNVHRRPMTVKYSKICLKIEFTMTCVLIVMIWGLLAIPVIIYHIPVSSTACYISHAVSLLMLCTYMFQFTNKVNGMCSLICSMISMFSFFILD